MARRKRRKFTPEFKAEAVRLVRVIVGIRDAFFDRHLTRHHLLDPIIGLLVSNKGANNLIDSAILDLLEFIRVCPIVALAKEVVSRHKQVLQGGDIYRDTQVESVCTWRGASVWLNAFP